MRAIRMRSAQVLRTVRRMPPMVHEVPYLQQPVDVTGPVRYAHGPDSHRHDDVPRGRWIDLQAHLRVELGPPNGMALGGRGHWVDSTDLTAEQTADRVTRLMSP